MTSKITSSGVLRRLGMVFVAMTMAGLLAACGGGSDAPPAAVAPAAAITAQPTDQSAVAGSTATFSVTATNATGYQWQRSSNGGISFTDVTGAVSASQTTAAVTPADSGAQYRVVVSGAGGNVTSSAATLTVTAAAVAPSITVQPAPQTITAGQDTSFSVTAAGTALAYQWQHSRDGGATFTDESGATAATFTLSAVAQLHNGHFLRVVVSNGLGSVTSTAALLTVNAATGAAVITQQPVNQSVTAPAAATFSAAASGTPAPTFQWQFDSGAGWGNIIGATSASYTTPATVVGDSGKQYRVMALNATGNVTSNVATLTVSVVATMPAITAQPVSVTITAGQNAQFTVAASGSPAPTFQWQLSTDNGANFSNITGATSAVFDVINAAQANNGRRFRAVVINGAGSVTSIAAVLTVNAAFAGGNIVFSRSFGIQSSPSDILLIKEDGTGEIGLTSTADHELFLGMAPGGRVVYSRTPAGGAPSLYSINIDGSGAILLVSPVSATDFIGFHGITLSGWVIYRRDTATTGRDLYAVKVDGSGTGPVVLANAGGNEDFAAITASGKVLYQAETTFEQFDVFSINADGTGKVALAAATDLREGWAGHQSAGQIAIGRCNFYSGICDHISVNENGGVGNLLARDTFPGQYQVVGVTKTGRFILSGLNVPNSQLGSQQDLYIDSIGTPLANSPDHEAYRGSTADGKVIYDRLVPIPNTSSFRNDLYIVNVDGTNTIRLATDAVLLAVAPDGRIVYATVSNNNPIRLSTVKVDGTGAVELGNFPNMVSLFEGMTANGRVIFSRGDGNVSNLSLRAVNTDGTGETLLAVRSYFVANTPGGKVVMRDNDNGNTNLSIANPDGTGFIRLATTGNNEFFNAALP